MRFKIMLGAGLLTVSILAVAANEELMIARHARTLVAIGASG